MEILSKPIPGYMEYTITSNGTVYRDEKSLKQVDNGYGYKKVNLWVKGKGYQRYIHRLVAETFIGPIKNKQINHIDGNKANNNVSNLEIVTAKQNTSHALNMGFRKRNIKVLTIPEIREIQDLLEIGKSTKDVAAKVGRSQRCIQYIKRGQHMGKLGWKRETK